MKSLLLTFFVVLVSASGWSQLVYNEGSYMAGIFWDNSVGTASESLGKNTVTRAGIRSAWENPATILLDSGRVAVELNYGGGHHWNLNARYHFAGGYVRLGNRLAIGLSTHAQTINNTVWNSIIAAQKFDVNRTSERAYSVVLAGSPVEGLNIGVSANRVVESAIEEVKTMDEMIYNVGFTYETPASMFKCENGFNQHIRLGLSFTNLTMNQQVVQRANDSVWQYRSLPIILRLGARYGISLPFKQIFGSSKMAQQPEQVDLYTYIQYADWLWKEQITSSFFGNNTMLGVGIEAMAYQLVALRLGYFYQRTTYELNPGERLATKNRRTGFTTGIGLNLPSHKWYGLPFDIHLDLMAQTFPDYLREEVSQAFTSPKFKDIKPMYSLGVKLILR